MCFNLNNLDQHFTYLAVPHDSDVMHNASIYYASFVATAGSSIFNYTVYINLTSTGSLLGIILSFHGSSIIESPLVFDNGLETKNFIIFNSVPSPYSVTNDIATIQESVIFEGMILDSVYPQDTNVLNFDLDLSVSVWGFTSSRLFEHRTVVVAEVVGKSIA